MSNETDNKPQTIVIKATVIDSTKDTEEHRRNIMLNVQDFCNKITLRAAKHDLSKLESPEKEGFDKSGVRLEDLTYNSKEYQASLVALSTTLEHHYKHNDHHPQHYQNGVAGMNLYSLVEMYEDWKASSKRTKDGDIVKSVTSNIGKFNIDEQLASILMNTALADKKEEDERK